MVHATLHESMYQRADCECVMWQVYVFCCAHAEQVKEHLKTAGWLQERASLTVKVCVLLSPFCFISPESLNDKLWL